MVTQSLFRGVFAGCGQVEAGIYHSAPCRRAAPLNTTTLLFVRCIYIFRVFFQVFSWRAYAERLTMKTTLTKIRRDNPKTLQANKLMTGQRGGFIFIAATGKLEKRFVCSSNRNKQKRKAPFPVQKYYNDVSHWCFVHSWKGDVRRIQLWLWAVNHSSRTLKPTVADWRAGSSIF